jgi:hypothetical protein
MKLLTKPPFCLWRRMDTQIKENHRRMSNKIHVPKEEGGYAYDASWWTSRRPPRRTRGRKPRFRTAQTASRRRIVSSPSAGTAAARTRLWPQTASPSLRRMLWLLPVCCRRRRHAGLAHCRPVRRNLRRLHAFPPEDGHLPAEFLLQQKNAGHAAVSGACPALGFTPQSLPDSESCAPARSALWSPQEWAWCTWRTPPRPAGGSLP